MESTLFQGCAVALTTPFNRGAVDIGALRALIDWHCQSGTDAIVALGTTGEAATLTDAERDFVLEECVSRVAGRIPVIAGCGANDTEKAVRYAKRAGELGADALLSVTPYYLKTTQEGLYGHYGRVADACDRPLILYNVPARTGVNLLPETAERLCTKANIAGVKEASGDISQVAEILARTRGRLAVYSGNDDQTIPVIALGGQGVISVTANVDPIGMRLLAHRALSGDYAGARACHDRLAPLMKALFLEPNPIPVKAALAILGRMSDEVRLPLAALAEPNRQILQKILS